MTKSPEGKSQLLVWDGQYGAQYQVDLRHRKSEHFRSYTLPSMTPERGQTIIQCQWDSFVTSNKLNNFYQFPKSSKYKDHERFLYPSKGLIDIVHTRNQFYPWMIFSGSSTAYEEESTPTTVYMQHNEDHPFFMTIDLEYTYYKYPHLQYFNVGEPISAMTTLFVWG